MGQKGCESEVAPVNKYTFLIFTRLDPAARQNFGLKRRPTEAPKFCQRHVTSERAAGEKWPLVVNLTEQFNNASSKGKFHININFAFICTLFDFIH